MNLALSLGRTLQYVAIEVIASDVRINAEISIPPLTDPNALKSILKPKY